MKYQRERAALKNCYPSSKWAARVDSFSARQVLSIIERLRKQGLDL